MDCSKTTTDFYIQRWELDPESGNLWHPFQRDPTLQAQVPHYNQGCIYWIVQGTKDLTVVLGLMSRLAFISPLGKSLVKAPVLLVTSK